VTLPNPQSNEQVGRWITNRAAELHLIITGKPMPTVGSIIASLEDQKPAKVNLNALLNVLAVSDLQMRYMQESLQSAKEAFGKMNDRLKLYEDPKSESG
jgi:hypothetical protein